MLNIQNVNFTKKDDIFYFVGPGIIFCSRALSMTIYSFDRFAKFQCFAIIFNWIHSIPVWFLQFVSFRKLNWNGSKRQARRKEPFGNENYSKIRIARELRKSLQNSLFFTKNFRASLNCKLIPVKRQSSY